MNYVNFTNYIRKTSKNNIRAFPLLRKKTVISLFAIYFSTVFAVVAYSTLSLFSVQAFAFSFVFSFCHSFYNNFLTCIIIFQVS